ncbi:TerD family protein [Coprococcus eutactus]|uniref:TerD family protein n=1 Tax=Coprococcus eutactus TaxID=33043 RepID=UPI0015702CBF|nr:TerD family protein [Coprococcus eutactus]NSE73800.1 TerD family protein [Coprococcus eutactus]
MNEILLRRKNKVILGIGTAKVANDRCITTIMKNIEELGYTFSREVFDVLRTYSVNELTEFYLELKAALMKLKGANVVYMPMYADFPKGVMDAHFSELYINAMVHYWSDGILYPKNHRKRVNDRLPLFDETKVKVLQLGSEADVRQIFDNICTSRTSISRTDREDIAYLFETENMKLPDNIPHKENAAYISALYLQKKPLANVSELRKYVKTATDVLRLVTAMSDGDVSLAENTRYKSFTRRQRRMIMELLSGCPNIEGDMLRYKERWIRIGERIHPSEFDCSRYTLEYDRAINAFDKLRNNRKIETFAGKVEFDLAYGEYESALAELVKRPGELARRLDQLLRETYKEPVIRSFASVAEKVSTPVLLQVREHFLHRAEQADVRVFFPKGSLAKCHSERNDLPDIDERYCQEVVRICENALVKIYGQREPMGKVYLSEDYRNYVVPFSQRSASKAMKTIVRGSRLPMDSQTNAVRAFIWWTNMDKCDFESYDSGRIDIDLSAAIFDENWNYMEHVSYTNLKSAKYKACHSGDIVNGGPVDGDGVSEFLDVDVDSVVRCGARYVVYQVYSFTCQTYADMPHAMFGWMERADVDSGEIYEPKTVEQKLDLTADSMVCIPVIFDCVKREFIWCDMNMSLSGIHANIGGNNLESNLSGVAAVCYSMVNVKKPDLYDLIALNVMGRGVLVDNREDADIVFDTELYLNNDTVENERDKMVITPYDTELFMGEYL